MIIKEIENLVFHDVEIDIEETKINLSKTSAIFKCVENTELPNKIEEKYFKFLFCLDKENKKITLYDCCVCLNKTLGDTIESIKIIYNKILIGDHITSLRNISLDRMDVVIDRKFHPYVLSIINNKWILENYSVSTGRNVVDGKATGQLKIEIIDNTHKSVLDDYLDVFNNIICILFWGIGYFPDTEEFSLIINDKKLTYINPNESICETNDIVHNYESLFPKYDNIPEVYKKWKKLYEDNLILFHIFFGIQKSHLAEEIKTFNYIQCLESLFSNNIFEEKFNVSYKEKIKGALLNALDEKKENELTKSIKKIINDINSNGEKYSFSDFKNSLQGKLNDINELSLNQKIKQMYCNKYSLKIFNYEYQNHLITICKKKTYNHRNFMAHITSSNQYFKKNENKLMHAKFKLLFRMIVIDLISMKYDEESFLKCIEKIDDWYKKNTISN